MGSYTLKEKESLVSVAKDNGFSNFHTIYDDPANASLRTNRPAVNSLRVGDVIVIPDKKEKTVVAPTGSAEALKVVIGRGAWNVEWKPSTAFCGDKVTLTGASNLPDGKVQFFTHSVETGSPKLADWFVTVAAGAFSQAGKIENVKMFETGTPPAARDTVHVEVTTKDSNLPSNIAILTVQGMKDGAKDTFSSHRQWGKFTVDPRFEQKIENYVAKVLVTMHILKGWGATYIDLTAAGIKGNVTGAPAGMRWARSTTGQMSPNQYHDGKDWKPLPKGFTVTAASYQCVGFYQSGSKPVSPYGYVYPQTFSDYDFNDPTFVTKRNQWIQKTHDVWTNKFQIRRKKCTSDPSTRCCRYDIEVAMMFEVVTTFSSDAVILAPGALRSNAGLFFMGDDRLEMAAHEAGHHMDNPDEYRFGAVDTTLNGDGAVNGIDADCIMGQNLTAVKKRHCHAFAVMTQRLLKAKYGRDEAYEIIEKV